MKVSFINKHLIRPSYQSLSDLLHSWKFLSWKFIKPRCDSSQRSTFASNIALLPSDVIDFARSEILAGNGFIVRYHVTSK